jgi:hypothetical protein
MQRLGTNEREAAVRDAATETALGLATRLELRNHGEGEIETIVGAAVGQAGLGEVPHLLVGIELGRVGGEVLEREPWHPTAQVVNRWEAMQKQAIPQHDDGAAKMAQEVGEKRANIGLANVVMVPLVVEAEALPARADRETGNHRDAVAAMPVAQERRLAARRPGPEHGGREHEAGFVYEDEVGPQPYGVFFTRGQALRFQRAIACSSRSRARRSGFWQLQPH